MTVSPFIYLASPYSHPDLAVRLERFQAACKAAAKLMTEGHRVFCPIAHSHPIEQAFDAPCGFEFWMRQDEPYMWACSSLYVLRIHGWTTSRGVRHEINIARARAIPIVGVDPV